MKFGEVKSWKKMWIVALLVAALAIGSSVFGDNPILCQPLSLETYSDLGVAKSSFEMGKKAAVQHSSQADIVMRVKKNPRLKLKMSGQTPQKGKRELTRSKSDEAAKRAVRCKLACFARPQIENNVDDEGRHVEENVKRKLASMRPGKKHLTQQFWADIIEKHKLCGTLSSALVPPAVAHTVGRELDAALKLCHHPNPAQKCGARLEALLRYHGEMNQTQIFGLLAGSFESPTLSRTMATKMQACILSWIGRTHAHESHSAYWSVVKDHYDSNLTEIFHKCVADGMARSHFLRSYRYELALFVEMEIATRVDVCVQQGATPASHDLDTLSQSSTIGGELFAPELRQDELRNYHAEIQERIKNLEISHGFMGDEVAQFERIMHALTENFEQATWESFYNMQLHVPFCNKDVETTIANANDVWSCRLQARRKMCALAALDVPRLPHERWLWGDSGPIEGAPQTVHIPEDQLYGIKNARDYLLGILPDGFITFARLKLVLEKHMSAAKKADESFWLEEAFIFQGHAEEALGAHLRSSFMAVLPPDGGENQIARDITALRLLVNGDVVSAQSPELIKELKTGYSLIVDISESRSPSAADAAKYAQWQMSILKRAENYAMYEVEKSDEDVQEGDVIRGPMAIKKLLKFMKANEKDITSSHLKQLRSFRWMMSDEEMRCFAGWEAEAVANERDRLNHVKRQAIKDVEDDTEANDRNNKKITAPIAPPLIPRKRPPTEASSSSSKKPPAPTAQEEPPAPAVHNDNALSSFFGARAV